MNNWTISRRVIAGFAVMLLTIVVLGVFALWRLTGLAQNVADLADKSLPSVLLLNEASKVSRGNLIDLLQIDATGSSERNAVLEQRIAANTVRRDELLEQVRRLPPDLREVVACRYLLELSEAETAAALQIPVGTVKSRLHRALTVLRKEVADV